MENIKRNYIGITLFCVSIILSFVDLKCALIVNGLGVIAFALTDQITAYIEANEKKHAEKKNFDDALEKVRNEILGKH